MIFILKEHTAIKNSCCWDFPGGTVVKNPPANAEDTGPSPGLIFFFLNCEIRKALLSKGVNLEVITEETYRSDPMKTHNC